MRVTLQLSKENRFTFFSFKNGELDVFKMTKGFVKNFGDTPPMIVEKIGVKKNEEKQLSKLMSELLEIYHQKQPQLKLQF